MVQALIRDQRRTLGLLRLGLSSDEATRERVTEALERTRTMRRYLDEIARARAAE